MKDENWKFAKPMKRKKTVNTIRDAIIYYGGSDDEINLRKKLTKELVERVRCELLEEVYESASNCTSIEKFCTILEKKREKEQERILECFKTITCIDNLRKEVIE